MKKFLFSTILLIFIIAVGWYYLPISWRKQAAFLMAAVMGRDTGEIKNIVKNEILVSDQEKRKSVLVKELKKNIAEIKKQTGGGTKKNTKEDSSVSPIKSGDQTIGALIGASEKALEELEKIGGGGSSGEKIIERVVEYILPSAGQGGQCRQVCK